MATWRRLLKDIAGSVGVSVSSTECAGACIQFTQIVFTYRYMVQIFICLSIETSHLQSFLSRKHKLQILLFLGVSGFLDSRRQFS